MTFTTSEYTDSYSGTRPHTRKGLDSRGMSPIILLSGTTWNKHRPSWQTLNVVIIFEEVWRCPTVVSSCKRVDEMRRGEPFFKEDLCEHEIQEHFETVWDVTRGWKGEESGKGGPRLSCLFRPPPEGFGVRTWGRSDRPPSPRTEGRSDPMSDGPLSR